MDYTYTEPGKKPHSGIELLLSILSIAVTLVLGFLFGMFAVIPAVIMAGIGIFLGVSSMRATSGRSGKGGLITGITSILLSIMIGGMVMSIGGFLRSDEVRSSVPTLAAYSGESWRGIAGLLLKMKSDNVDFDQLSSELSAFGNTEQKTVSAAEDIGNGTEKASS